MSSKTRENEFAGILKMGYDPLEAVRLSRQMAACRGRDWWADSRTWEPCPADAEYAVPDVGRLLFYQFNGYDGLRH